MYYYYHQAQCNRQQNPCSFRSRPQPQVSKEGRREGRDCLLRGPGAWPCAQASQAPCPVPPARLPRRYCCLRVVVSDSSLSASHLVSIAAVPKPPPGRIAARGCILPQAARGPVGVVASVGPAWRPGAREGPYCCAAGWPLWPAATAGFCQCAHTA